MYEEFFNKQKIPDPGNRILQTLYYQMVVDVNRNAAYKHRMHGLLLDNNTMDSHLAMLLGDPDADLDCCFLGIQSWGHTSASRQARPDLEDGDTKPESLLAGPQDFHVELSDRIHEIKREHLWFKESDCSWHRPIIATVREIQTKNWRKRTAAGLQRVKERKAESLALAKAKKLAKAKTTSRRRSSWGQTPNWSSWDDSWWYSTESTWTWH